MRACAGRTLGRRLMCRLERRPRHIKEETSIRMTTDQNDFSIVRFSTDDLPEKDRGAIWREHFGPSVFKVEIEPPPPNTAVKVDIAAPSLPGLQLLSGLYARVRMIRTRRPLPG